MSSSLEKKEKIRKIFHFSGLAFMAVIVVLLVLVQMNFFSEEGDSLVERVTDILGILLAATIVGSLILKNR